MRWDPDRYLTYADHRGRPFLELLARVRPQPDAAAPRRVVDLGCGPGNVTRLLAERWPEAVVAGVDSSPEMVERARAEVPGIAFELGDLRDWSSPEPVDLLVSNATLQWVPGHLELLPRLLDQVAPGGTFAFSVPGNYDEPSHTLRAALAAEAPYVDHVQGIADPASRDPATYLDVLSGAGAVVDAWETTYLHVLTGEDPVFTWISGTGARPTLQALPDDLREDYVADLKARLRTAYETRQGPDGPFVVLPFRRIFVVAERR